MTQENSAHISVLLAESIAALNIKADGLYVDATFGRGGHSRAILQQLGPSGRLIAFDRDPSAIAVAKELAAQDPRFSYIHAPFSQLQQQLTERDLCGQIDGLLFDFGVSSPQLDEADRGFSFMKAGPLDMRMDTSSGVTAAQWLANIEEEKLSQVIRDFGEERFARRIARAIVRERAENPLTRTEQLASLIAATIPTREKHKHPATRTFQAIRIAINDEFGEIDSALQQIAPVLATDGRVAIISFHSLEDRRVKQFITKAERGEPLPPDLPLTEAQRALHQKQWLVSVGKKLKPSAQEIALNPRSRSSVLRVAQRTAVPCE